uniref:CARD domain-containing protein n=1 Tax=Amphilophus citrinellus TaxID=61819 RepID=A0A3Q0S396_AMPCI
MADKELHRVRTGFVEKVSETVIKQLLDDLAEDRVLNDGECESILERNTTRADKARCLIDIVKRKGPKASNTMIAHFQRREPLLFDNLGLAVIIHVFLLIS